MLLFFLSMPACASAAATVYPDDALLGLNAVVARLGAVVIFNLISRCPCVQWSITEKLLKGRLIAVCTPGIVLSLINYLLAAWSGQREEMDTSFKGHQSPSIVRRKERTAAI